MASDAEKRSGLGRLLDALYLAAGWAAGFFLVTIFALMIALSGGRQLGFNIPAGDDFAAWSMAAMAFLGLAHTFRSGEMIRVGMLLERLDGRVRHALELFSLAVALLCVSYFGYFAARMTWDSWRFNDMAQGVVAMPLWIPQSGVALGLAILGVALLDELIHVAKGNAPTFTKPPPASPDELVARIVEGGGV